MKDVIDSRLRGNDVQMENRAFYESVKNQLTTCFDQFNHILLPLIIRDLKKIPRWEIKKIMEPARMIVYSDYI